MGNIKIMFKWTGGDLEIMCIFFTFSHFSLENYQIKKYCVLIRTL